MKDLNRRNFMKMLAGVMAAVGLTGKAEEPKYKVGCSKESPCWLCTQRAKETEWMN